MRVVLVMEEGGRVDLAYRAVGRQEDSGVVGRRRRIVASKRRLAGGRRGIVCWWDFASSQRPSCLEGRNCGE